MKFPIRKICWNICHTLSLAGLVSGAFSSSALAQVPFDQQQMASLSCADLGFPIFDAEIERRVSLPGIEYRNVSGNESNQKGNSFETFAIESLYLSRNTINYPVTGWSSSVRPDAVNALWVIGADGTISFYYNSQFYDAKAVSRIPNNNQGKKYLDYLSVDAPSVREANVNGVLDYLTIRDSRLSDSLYNTAVLKGVNIFQTFACDPGTTVSNFQVGVNDMRMGKAIWIAPGRDVPLVYFNYARARSMFTKTQQPSPPPSGSY